MPLVELFIGSLIVTLKFPAATIEVFPVSNEMFDGVTYAVALYAAVFAENPYAFFARKYTEYVLLISPGICKEYCVVPETNVVVVLV